MKSTHLALVFALSLSFAALAAPGKSEKLVPLVSDKKLEGIFGRPVPGPKQEGPNMLFLVGGRPYEGNGFGGLMISQGARPIILNSVYLAGNGGSIKQFPGDKREPRALDGITPEFKRLDKYSLVAFACLPADKQTKILTAERVEMLRKFVKDGGALLLTRNAPDCLGDLLPFEPSEDDEVTGEVLFETRPQAAEFSCLPAKWGRSAKYNMISPKRGVKVLSRIVDGDGIDVTPAIVEMPYGAGRVVYANIEFERSGGDVTQFGNWAYASAFKVALIGHAAGYKVDPTKAITKGIPEIKKNTLEKSEIAVSVPAMELKDCADVQVVKRKATFSNGLVVLFSDSGKASVTFPGHKTSYIESIKLPEVVVADKQRKLDDSTAEATNIKEGGKKFKFKWKFVGVEKNGNVVVARFSDASGASLEWSFKAADLQVDKRKYACVASKIAIDKSPLILTSLVQNSVLRVPAVLERRMDAYQPPRGYEEYDFAKRKSYDTMPMGFFGSSQPFSYISAKDGVMVEFVTEPACVSVRHVKEGKKITSRAGFGVGRKHSHAEGPWFFQAYSNEPEANINPYIGIWQFCRRTLRAAAGMQELPNLPFASHDNTCSDAQIDTCLAMAHKLGFRNYYWPACPSSIESLAEPARLKNFHRTTKAGIDFGTWSPCDYGHGTHEKVFKEHPEFYVRDEKNQIFHYMGNYPVLNMRKPEVLAWYQKIAQTAVDNGLKMLYQDMGGAAWANVSFDEDECDCGMVGVLENFRFYNKRGVRAAVEGMNPLVLDMYWYRYDKYNSFAGKEFALMGSHPSANIDSEFIIDPFRSFMYDACGNYFTDTYYCRFDRLVGETENLERVAGLLPGFYGALDATGMPFIRQTKFGTSWISDKGGAFFFWDNVKSFDAKLPEGYAVSAIYDKSGKKTETTSTHFDDVASESVIVFVKK